MQIDHVQPPSEQRSPKRRRVALACGSCRERKVRCDGAKPRCGACQKRGNTAEQCEYLVIADTAKYQTERAYVLHRPHGCTEEITVFNRQQGISNHYVTTLPISRTLLSNHQAHLCPRRNTITTQMKQLPRFSRLSNKQGLYESKIPQSTSTRKPANITSPPQRILYPPLSALWELP